jgi:hypothetical protein
MVGKANGEALSDKVASAETACIGRQLWADRRKVMFVCWSNVPIERFHGVQRGRAHHRLGENICYPMPGMDVSNRKGPETELDLGLNLVYRPLTSRPLETHTQFMSHTNCTTNQEGIRHSQSPCNQGYQSHQPQQSQNSRLTSNNHVEAIDHDHHQCQSDEPDVSGAPTT